MLVRSIGRAVKAILNALSFGFIKFAEKVEENPQIVGMEIEDIKQDENQRLGRIKNALGGLRGQVIGVEDEIKAVSKEINDLVSEQEGFFALMEQRTNELRAKGKSDQDIQADPDFVSYLADYNDHGSTIEAKKAHLATLKTRAEQMNGMYEDKLLEVQELRSHIDGLDAKKHITVATLEMNRAFEQISDEFGKIGGSKNADRMARIDQITREAQGRAETAARISGTDTKVRSMKARQAAQRMLQNKDLLQRLGMGAKEAPAAAAPVISAPVAEGGVSNGSAKVPEN